MAGGRGRGHGGEVSGGTAGLLQEDTDSTDMDHECCLIHAPCNVHVHLYVYSSNVHVHVLYRCIYIYMYMYIAYTI